VPKLIEVLGFKLQKCEILKRYFLGENTPWKTHKFGCFPWKMDECMCGILRCANMTSFYECICACLCVCVCVCTVCVCVFILGSLSTKMFWNCFGTVPFCSFFRSRYSKYLISVLTLRKMQKSLKNALSWIFVPPANFLLIIMKFFNVNAFQFCGASPSWWQSSGIDLWQRHCILLYLKEIFLEIGTRQKGEKWKVFREK